MLIILYLIIVFDLRGRHITLNNPGVKIVLREPTLRGHMFIVELQHFLP